MTQLARRAPGRERTPHAAADRHPALSSWMLLAAVAWAVAASGGTRPVDLALVTGLTAGALLLTGVRRTDLRRAVGSPVLLSLLALVGWVLVVGLTTAGAGGATLRMPWLLVVATLGCATADRLPTRGREHLMDGLVVVGVVVAASAVAQWTAAVHAGDPLPVRAASVLGYPNAAGVLLVATGLVTLHLHRTGRLGRQWGVTLVAVLGLGVLATGSRLALLLVLAAIALVAWRRRGTTGLLTASVVALPVVALLAQRFATSSTERLLLWAEAVPQLVAHPVAGRGPAPQLFVASRPGKPTTHAHDELLQWGLEYGLGGVGLAVVVVALVVAALRTRRLVDPFLALACVAVASLALTDFALRTTAAALVLAVLVPLAWRPATRF